MKTEIEIYRGWTISFDTEKETFYCHSEQYDTDFRKTSYPAIKKWIDDFIKENATFTPFWIEPNRSYYKSEPLRVIGIRKDGRFIYEDKNSNKQQLSEYSEADYILRNEDNDRHRVLADEIQGKIDVLIDEKKEVLSKITGVKLTEYKKSIINQ